VGARDTTTIVRYEEKYREELRTLLLDFSQELFEEGTVDLDAFIKGHWAIYLSIKDDRVTGLCSFMINDYFGLRKPTIGFTYLFVEKPYRRTRALHLLNLQALYVALELDLPLEYYCAAEASERIAKNKVNGKELYVARSINREEQQLKYNYLYSKLNKD
jgi:hypothetical protein